MNSKNYENFNNLINVIILTLNKSKETTKKLETVILKKKMTSGILVFWICII